MKTGKLRYWGLSNETAWGVTEFSRVAEQLDVPKPISIQNAYNLLNRHFDAQLAEATRHEGVGLLAYSALAFGLLSGKHAHGIAPRSRFALFEGFGDRYRKPNVDEAVAAYTALAQQHRLSPAQLALAFVRSRSS
jgi:aryl-alcohol dehydrogenase-like predicted oxidoreductase